MDEEKYREIKKEAHKDLKESFANDFEDEDFPWDALAYGLVQDGSPLLQIFSEETLLKAKIFFHAEDMLRLVEQNKQDNTDELQQSVLTEDEDEEFTEFVEFENME